MDSSSNSSESEGAGPDDERGAGVVSEETLGSDADDEVAESPAGVIAEVLPGVAVVYGDVPAGLPLEPIDMGLVSENDFAQITAMVASIGGNAATVGGNLGNALASVQGLYRVSDATRALLQSGGALAVKDGANLGAIFANGDLVAQARFIPVTAISAAQTAAAIGPAVAMIAIQVKLSEISGLVKTNIAVTRQVLMEFRRSEWAELKGLATTVDRAIGEARQAESVPEGLIRPLDGTSAALDKQLDHYRENVKAHIKQIHGLHIHQRREYLDTNAEAIVFDTHALLTSLKAWTGYHALRVAHAREASAEDPREGRLAEIVEAAARAEFERALADARVLTAALRRELWLLAELPGNVTIPLTQGRRDSKATQLMGSRLLHAIEPLASAFAPPPQMPELPKVVVAPSWVDPVEYLSVLRWLLDDGEALRALAFPYTEDAGSVMRATGKTALKFPIAFSAEVARGITDVTSWRFGPAGVVGDAILSVAKGEFASTKIAAEIDKAGTTTLVAVTSKRVLVTDTKALVRHGTVLREVALADVKSATVLEVPVAGRWVIRIVTEDAEVNWSTHLGAAKSDVDNLVDVFVHDDARDGVSETLEPSATGVDASVDMP